ncbi:MAG: nitrogenase cofactor biosynthesis protein NifB [Intestinibacillus sp.]
MSQNLVNLNVNPCKMCMPMGSATAFYGIAKCMTILHGSQGCATYIRRHMATHYNEPVDIASTSLTEQGTVFGGEANLMKGLKNMVALYQPEVIGVATTCLAETIGEDVERYIGQFHADNPEIDVKIIPVASAGYGGTQYEGFFHALRAIVEHVDMDDTPNGKLNVITGPLSPADTRAVKSLLDGMGLAYILLPDLSDNLDGAHNPTYDRLPQGGATLAEIGRMAGARATIELTTFAEGKLSPGEYLRDTYGVPLYRLNTPVGLRDTDALVNQLKALGGAVSDALRKERGRYLDAMVDSHKYNAEGRAVVFGEPDFVYSMARLCCENGVMPVLCATGAKCPALGALLMPDLKKVAGLLHIGQYEVLDDCDFDTIEARAQALGANLMIGSSDGRRVAEKLHLPLVRCAFPCHDHVGGQRVRTALYDGSLTLLDRVTNELLSRKEGAFRELMYEKYYEGEGKGMETRQKSPAAIQTAEEKKALLEKKTLEHPCYNGCGGQYARMHLPVAPACNIQCNYCVRKFDCPNESRPGVTTEVLMPEAARDKYLYVRERMPNLKVVGIAGPGDSLAEWEKTRETLRLIREADPEVTFCLSTNGLLLPMCADELAAIGVSHVTVTLNAVDPAIGAKIYKHVDYMGTRYTGETGAAILMANQLAGIKRVCDLGLICKVNIVMLRGVNDGHIPAVVEKARELGCMITNIMQMIPVAGSAFENMELTNNKEIMEMRRKCGEIMPQMYHCKQCRADAIGTLGDDRSLEFRGCSSCHSGTEEQPKAEEPAPLLFAVASKGGVLVDQHFGHVNDFYIYEYKNGDIRFRERRTVSKYCDGGSCDGMGGGKRDRDQAERMNDILKAVSDCAAVVCMRIGDKPRQKLAEKGILLMTTYDRIEDAVRQAVEQYKSESKGA